MSPDPKQLRDCVLKYFSGYEVTTAYDAGCCGYYAHRSFESYGWESLVVNPADIHIKGRHSIPLVNSKLRFLYISKTALNIDNETRVLTEIVTALKSKNNCNSCLQ
jgi:hypothetical protein